MINNKNLGEGLYSMVCYSASREMVEFPCDLEIESWYSWVNTNFEPIPIPHQNSESCTLSLFKTHLVSGFILQDQNKKPP